MSSSPPSAQNKTRPTAASVEERIDALSSDGQRADCRALLQLMREITGEQPRMWGPSIIGFGSYRYRYDSGREGESPLVGFAARGRELVVYLGASTTEQEALLGKLGRHRMGKSCLYIRSLAEVDESVLRSLVEATAAELKTRHGRGGDPAGRDA